MTNIMDVGEYVTKLCEVLYDKKAVDIVSINIKDKTVIADYFIVCSGRSNTAVKAICDEVEEKSELLGLRAHRKEGYQEGRWIVLDMGDVLIHIFHPEERAYYNMERLWADEQNTVFFSKIKDEELNNSQ